MVGVNLVIHIEFRAKTRPTQFQTPLLGNDHMTKAHKPPNHSAIPTVTFHCLLPFSPFSTPLKNKTQLQSKRGRRKTSKDSSFSAESILRIKILSKMSAYSWEDNEEKNRLIKVVEYLEPLMSKELLCKFPDNSAFDFDYSQSTIWSPLVPRPYNPMDLDVITPIKLPSDFEMAEKNSLKKASSNLKKKLLFNGFGIGFSISKSSRKKRMKNKKMVSDFSPKPLQDGGAFYPNKKKGWSKLLKAAAKHFKKKKKDPTSQMKLYF